MKKLFEAMREVIYSRSKKDAEALLKLFHGKIAMFGHEEYNKEFYSLIARLQELANKKGKAA